MQPFEKAELNFLNIFNELIGLLASYIILPLQDNNYTPDSQVEIGEFAVYVFYFSGATNLIIIAILAIYNLIR